MFTHSTGTDLTFDDLFGAATELEPFDIPELGGKRAYIRQPSAAEVRDFISGRDVDSLEKMSEESFAEMDKLVARSLVDASGNRLIAEGQEHMLATLPYKVYIRLANAVTAGVFEAEGGEGSEDGAQDPDPTTA